MGRIAGIGLDVLDHHALARLQRAPGRRSLPRLDHREALDEGAVEAARGDHAQRPGARIEHLHAALVRLAERDGRIEDLVQHRARVGHRDEPAQELLQPAHRVELVHGHGLVRHAATRDSPA